MAELGSGLDLVRSGLNACAFPADVERITVQAANAAAKIHRNTCMGIDLFFTIRHGGVATFFCRNDLPLSFSSTRS